MLRSAFRGKQPADSTAKDEREAKNAHGKSHFFFHRENGGQLESREDQISTMNDNVTERGVSYNASDGELYIDCNHEFLESTPSSASDKESANEEDGGSTKCLSAESGVIVDEEKKDNRNGSFSNSERQIYEMQLAQLQEQLVNTMIDYQDMCSQVKKLKAIDVEKLQRELQEEKERNNELKEKLKQKYKAQSSKLQRKNAGRMHSRHAQSAAADSSEKGIDDWVHLEGEEHLPFHLSSSHDTNDDPAAGSSSQEHEEATHDVPDGIHTYVGQLEQHAAPSSAEEPHRVQRVKTKLEMWKMQAIDLLVDRLWDFVNDEPEATDDEDGEGEPLAVKRNYEWFEKPYQKPTESVSTAAGIKPITSFVKSVGKVLTWSNPTASFLIFLVYMYSVWHGYLFSLILLVAIWELFMNYLHAKGIAKQLGFVEKAKDEGNSSEDHSWSDKFQLVLQVARKVQNTLGKMADSLEKVKNLLMWQHPVATRKLFTALCVALLASLLLRGPTLFLLMGLFLGIKLFIVNPIHHRFPKVKRRYDSTAKLWRELPTDVELAARLSEAETYQEALQHASSASSSSSPSNSNPSESFPGPSTSHFSEKFKLPTTEFALPGWEDGKRCALMDKEKPLSNVKHGKLFLTQSYLCFEKFRSSSSKHIVIKLETITSISKAKPIGIMPGTGMALEVHVRGVDKPYIFGGIIGRDDVFESIKATGRAADIPWALM